MNVHLIDSYTQKLTGKLNLFWELATKKTLDIQENYSIKEGAPVYTVKGKYTARGWTEWTRGFQFGIPLLIYEVTGNSDAFESTYAKILQHMPEHITHFGVHDHGFNIISTYGNLLRLANKNRIVTNQHERALFELAIKTSGAVQAKRWTSLGKSGYIYSFNGPHSLFIDTIRTCRVLIAADLLGHTMQDEGDTPVHLFDRAIQHALTTAEHAIYRGTGKDYYDIAGRVAHESIFNINDGQYRCPNTQQGYSPFSTWSRGLAWAILGYAEFLEFLIDKKSEKEIGVDIPDVFKKSAIDTANFYLNHCTLDGIPFWDTGAPNIHKLGDYTQTISDPYNKYEPLDSSAAAIAAQGLIRMGKILGNAEGDKFLKAGLDIAITLLSEPYISLDENHQGLLLHSVYHRPNGWDYIAPGQSIPNGESSMWGDYHFTELCLLIHTLLNNSYYTFYDALIK